MEALIGLKNEFIFNEIWTLTFSAAFQRASVYSSHEDEILKNEFKIKTRDFIETILMPDYETGITLTDSRHINNIYRLSEFTANYSPILNGERLNFGISQKLLNLYLKYLWCLNLIPEPPHFPVDRRIQESIRFNPIIAWTRIIEHTQYMQIIDFVRGITENEQTIAQLELDHFDRRRNQI
jgi:hypothetical protein